MKLRILIIAVLAIAVLGGGAFALWYFLLRPGRLDFDKLGGTILVYELDKDQDPDKGAPEIGLMVESLQRRLDPDGRGYATVAALGKDRIEIRIPRTDEKQGAIERTKEIIAIQGHLEFLILANENDDSEAIAHAKAVMNSNDDVRKQLDAAQEAGSPPPPLREIGANDLKVFTVKLPKGQQSIVTYRWVALGPHELRALNLDNDAENDATRNKPWLEAKEQRGKATTLVEQAGGRKLLEGALFYSRDCKNKNLDEKGRQTIGVEYFVLAREAELDPQKDAKLSIAERRTRPVDGSLLTRAAAQKLNSGRFFRDANAAEMWAVDFTLTSEGAALFRTLTKKNVPDGNPNVRENRRHLAILVDHRVLSAPTINSEIAGGRGQISGNFTEREARNLAAVLGGGLLPGKLKLPPVSETEVPPKTASK